MNHSHNRMGEGVFRKFIPHCKRILAHFADGRGEVIGLARKEGSKKVCLGVANGNDIVLSFEPFFPGIASSNDKFLKGIMGNTEYISEKHDAGRVRFFESQGLFSSENLIHNDPNFTA